MNPPSQPHSANGDRSPQSGRRQSAWEKIFLKPETPPPEAGTSPPPKESTFAKTFLKPDLQKEASPVPPPPCAVQFDETKVFWAMQNLPAEEAVKHFAICGCIGSGKTTAIDLLLQSIMPRFRPGRSRPEQLVIFDAKCDLVPKLAAWGVDVMDENVWLLNPFDERTCTWNLAEAVSQPAMARHLASLLIPEEKGSNAPYFWQAAQQLVFSALVALDHIAPGQWTLRDLLLSLQTRERLVAITARDERAHAVAMNILNDALHALGVMSTMAAKLARFEEVAALWHTARNPRRFVIQDFLQRPGVLILGHDPVFKESRWPFNAILLKALTQEILRGTETRQPRYWFVLDEFRVMERVDCLRELLNLGRSKGAAVTLGTQSIDGLEEVYGEQGTNTLLEQCTYKSFLRAGGPKTAEWAERFINKVRRIEQAVTETRSPSGPSTAVQYSLHDRSILTAGYFLNLDLPRPGGHFVGVHDVPSMDCFLTTRRPFAQVIGWRTPPLNIPAIRRRTNIQEQHLKPWDEAEKARFLATASPPTHSQASATATTPKEPPPQRPPGQRLLPQPPADDNHPDNYPFDSYATDDDL